MVEAVVELRKAGDSLREIARKTSLSRSQVTAALILAGVHRINHKKVEGGFAPCVSCGSSLPLAEFPKYVDGKFICRECERARMHEYQIKKRGCTLEKYKELLDRQNGCCAVCNKPFGHTSCKGVRARLAVDHDHKTGRIRGLLCGKCNRAIGWFGDSVELLQAAIRYLNETQ